MKGFLSVAVLGSTGYVGLELVKFLSKHPKVKINFLGSENSSGKNINFFNKSLSNKKLPLIDLNKNFNHNSFDYVFLSLPHGISNHFVKNLYNKIKIIDLSADFRLDDISIYKKSYDIEHICPDLLSSFTYGLVEIYKDKLKCSKNIAIPGCYPTSIILPLFPLLINNCINEKNIIIDSKSGYSGAGKNFLLENIKNTNDLNFYNYNTNSHRHIEEISQELNKFSKTNISFSFNPHILPNFRGMMSTIYCELKNGFNYEDVKEIIKNFSNKNHFIKYFDKNQRADFFSVQYTNNCILKIFKHIDSSQIIIVSLIDNLVKGAAGQAIQCLNVAENFNEKLSLE